MIRPITALENTNKISKMCHNVVKEEKRDLILKHKEELIDIKEQINNKARFYLALKLSY